MSDIERDPEFELTDELASFIEALHGSEINGEISWFFDNVWGAKIGDKLNGYMAEATELPSIGHAARWLSTQNQPCRCYLFVRSRIRAISRFDPILMPCTCLIESPNWVATSALRAPPARRSSNCSRASGDSVRGSRPFNGFGLDGEIGSGG